MWRLIDPVLSLGFCNALKNRGDRWKGQGGDGLFSIMAARPIAAPSE
jgi:hypothetical protein